MKPRARSPVPDTSHVPVTWIVIRPAPPQGRMMKLDTAFGAAHSALFLLPIVRELLIAIGGRVASRTVGETDGVSVAIFPGGGLEMTRQCPGVCTRELPARDVISASKHVRISSGFCISPQSRRHLAAISSLQHGKTPSSSVVVPPSSPSRAARRSYQCISCTRPPPTAPFARLYGCAKPYMTRQVRIDIVRYDTLLMMLCAGVGVY